MHVRLALGSAQNRFVAHRIFTFLGVALLCSACGVHGHPHARPELEGANDFAPVGAGDSLAKPTHTGPSRDAGNDGPADASVMDAGGSGSDAAMQDAGGQTAANGLAGDMRATAGAAAKGDKRNPATLGAAAEGGGSAGAPSGAAGAGAAPALMEADAEAGACTPATSIEPATPTSPETPSIVLGGVSLHKEDVLAFIHFGHSNMSGQATNPPELRQYFFTETHPRVWMYHVGTPPVLATEPTAREDMDQTAGPGVALLKQAAELAPNKHFISLGYGHGGASCIHFTPGWAYFEEITKAAVAIKDRVTFAGIVVMLGNIEGGGNGETAVTLPDCFVKLASAVREAVGSPDLPMLISGYEVEATGLFSIDREGPQKVIAELAKVPGLVSNSAIVPADGIPMQDDHHFNLAGHMLWTKRVLDTMQAKCWFPWATNSTMPANH